jgi:integrase
MRRGDYPKGESLGVKVATKEAILKVLNNKRTRNKTTINAMILFLKDSGLRISDARLINYGDISEELERGDEFISLTQITQKQGTVAKCFIGPEAVQALKEYLESREKGSRHVPPERLTAKSPLFKIWLSGNVKRILRHSFSSLIRAAFLRVNEPNISAHSLRKYVQTNLEAAGTNVNWIDQILGHKLINSRDAYSKPTDEQLRQAYIKAYKFLRVYPESNTPNLQTANDTETHVENKDSTKEDEFTIKIATNHNEVTDLMRQGYQYVTELDGLRYFRKPK